MHIVHVPSILCTCTCMYSVCTFTYIYVFGVFSFPQLSILFSHLMQETEQPLVEGVYVLLSKSTSVKQVTDMPAYSYVFQSKVHLYNTVHLQL